DVEVVKVGYEAETRTVGVGPGKTRTVEVTLEPILGEVSIRAEPAGAELFVDGKPVGNANQTLRLVAIPHEIIVRADGHEPHRVTVLPRPGVAQSLDVRLKTPEQIKTESRPRIIRTKHGQELVLIEGGRFTMGASRREPGRRANETRREVELTRPFYLSRREISNEAFREFRKQHLSGAVEEFNLENDYHPVVRVTWEDAALFCNWLSAEESLPAFYERRNGTMVPVEPVNTGYRLPTEAEWAFAARFSSGKTPLKYPWGDALPVEPGSGNYADQSAHALLEHSIAEFNDGYPTTAPIDSFTPNSLGLFNLGGNVAEWMHDIYTIYARTTTVARDPLGAGDGEYHVIRGSSWMDSSVSELRLSYRDFGNGPRPDLGFRIARYAE
ncbi:MAG: SUMF1/EgtB/PvdO family nonheme iron enzyme, partial [Acidobacteriota bacterium]|nr:SUMF1/EgtB/PvdO family nonheme iron enzyme [Acidobacteriota bacterium]